VRGPAVASEMRAAPNPRAFTRVVWGLTSRPPGSPGGLSSGFPFARRGSSPSSAFGWFPFVRRSPVVPFGRCPVPVSLWFPSGFPFPWAIFTLALPRGGPAGVGPGRQGPRSAVLPRHPRLGRPRSARAAGGQRPGTRDAAAGSPGTSGRERTTSSRPAAIAERDRNAGRPSPLSPNPCGPTPASVRRVAAHRSPVPGRRWAFQAGLAPGWPERLSRAATALSASGVACRSW
jgi:hypothetical protein